MAKSKGKLQKLSNVFHVTNGRSIKSKSKAKPVKSTLKKINVSNNDKVSKVNKAFTELHKGVAQLKKMTASKAKPNQISKPTPEADVDNAADLFPQL
ncbi:ribosomal biogenesis factor-like [Rana temporaria]|uniref:ribosomal biogenesis factor-like n=1 Tax=Rana temporaria TaxID=8407 RepID=UPI001AADA562|nr:ribosomal biogenesis factor-like [Rana temporaria]